MPSAKSIQVKESTKELKQLLKTSPRLIIPRIRMLIEIKRYEFIGGISKRNLAEMIGVNHNSKQRWRTIYSDGDISKLTDYVKNEVSEFIKSQVQKLKLSETKKTCAFDYIFSHQFWTNV